MSFSPMMNQYLKIKEENPGTILFFRLGDFYEMFFDDAKLVSKELELTLTQKACGQEEKAPMCGVPYHSCEAYIARLVGKGYKVAICEQTEDPAEAKGLVDRSIVRVVTPGTAIEGLLLEEGKNNFLASLYRKDDGTAAIAFVDSSTGEFKLTEFSGEGIDAKIINELGKNTPKEIIANRAAITPDVKKYLTDRLTCCLDFLEENSFDSKVCEEAVKKHFEIDDLKKAGLKEGTAGLSAAGAALEYLFSARMTNLENINGISLYSSSQFMRLDNSARRNLELFETLRSGEKKGSLLGVIDKTNTSMGKRLIRSYLEQPLVNKDEIEARLSAVEELHSNTALCFEITDCLSGIFDIERLMSRVVYQIADSKDLLALASAAGHLPKLKRLIKDCKSRMIRSIYNDLDELSDIHSLVNRAIDYNAPQLFRDGGIIKSGYNKDLDSLRDDMNGGSKIISSVEARERERTGIKNLKVGYNKVFGYYIEITNSFKHLTPPEYTRKQTTTNAERYITEELKNLEQRVLGAKEKSIHLEQELFADVRRRIARQQSRVQTSAKAVALLDVLTGFAVVARNNHYCRPEIYEDGRIEILEGRHPVVETVNDTPFVSNDTHFDMKHHRCAVITGPNMAGKSTYMRQVALITIMAQMGCFVPAKSAKIGIVDAVYTRVGASDDLFSGQSTFMVEMNEVSEILESATKDSLVILDEIGRGTSTFDGMSIAQAVLEYIVSNKLGAKAMFATHYHELTFIADRLKGVDNFSIAVKKRGDEITFLRRIVKGGADRSYGIEVAALAGVPKSVVKRAKEILAELESGQHPGCCNGAVGKYAGETADTAVYSESAKDETENEGVQMSLMSGEQNPVIKILKALDIDTLTPIEAMNALYELKKQAESV